MTAPIPAHHWRSDSTAHGCRGAEQAVPRVPVVVVPAEDWKERRGKARGRADTDRVLSEAAKLFDELSDMLTEIRRELLGSGRPR